MRIVFGIQVSLLTNQSTFGIEESISLTKRLFRLDIFTKQKE